MIMEMENVIVLDSSEDEGGEQVQLKKVAKPAAKKAKLQIRSKDRQTSIVCPRAELSITTVDKFPADCNKATINQANDTNRNVLAMANVMNNNKDRIASTNVAASNEKNFIRKIDSGEITIVPLIPTINKSNNASIPSTAIKRKQSTSDNHIEVKRIRPIKIAEVVSIASRSSAINSNRDIDLDARSKESFDTFDDDSFRGDNSAEEMATNDINATNKVKKIKEKTPMNEEFAELLNTCRAADPSHDMEKLINRKLIRYYETVHPDFVSSKSFCKTIRAVNDEIRLQPNLVYLKISSVLEELNIRRKSGQIVVSNEEVTSTGSERKDFQIKRLNKALYLLKKRIAALDDEDVNWDDEENSQFMISERLKKRACEIYEKICDITGESKNAQRLVKKPIKFQDTGYAEFNKTLQKFVNETKVFPDMFDVLRCLEHCNLQNGYRLTKEECKKIAQDAFIKVGKLLQKRRKTDLYETVSYFTGSSTDPAIDDKTLESKLTDNQKYHKQINEIIDQYAQQQDKTNPTMMGMSDPIPINNIITHNRSTTSTSTLNSLADEFLVKDDQPSLAITVNNNQSKDDVNSFLIIDHARTLSHMDFIVKDDDDDDDVVAHDVDHLLDGPSILSVETLNNQLNANLTSDLNSDLFATCKKHGEIIISSDEEDNNL